MHKFFTEKKKGFTLVELMIVVAIIGILAAIAIPAFLRYIKQSKTSEAEAIMKKMAEGSKAYFTSEQKYQPAADGDQPWHTVGTVGTATAPGLPIPFSDYVFPGGILANGINTSVSGCGNGAPGTSPPIGGSKAIPCLGVFPVTGSMEHAVLNKLRVVIQDPLYFEYAYEPTGKATGATTTITATADFTAGGPAHNIEQIVSIDPVTQEVVVGPSVVRNEFE